MYWFLLVSLRFALYPVLVANLIDQHVNNLVYMSAMLSMTLATELYIVPEFLACILSGPYPAPLKVMSSYKFYYCYVETNLLSSWFTYLTEVL